jgi:glycosyltransferase involved in cell wall biosynthesis
MQLNWYSPCWTPFDGYGQSAKHMILALESLGHTIGLSKQSSLHVRGGFGEEFINERPTLHTADAQICYGLPPSFRDFPRPKLFGFSMWESDTPPHDWVEPLSWPIELWVPSNASKDCFAPYTSAQVHVIPLGVEPESFPSIYRRRRDGKTRFLHMAATHGMWRKGADLAIAAFQEAFFDQMYSVELVIKAAEGIAPVSDDPRIVYETGCVPSDQLAAYYHGFDALLFTSRGEGFGLIALEAACSGMCVVHTGQSAMADYEEIGTTVPSRRVTRDGAVWYEADVHQLARRLMAIVKNYDGYMEMGLNDARLVRRQWAWDRSARAIIERLHANGIDNRADHRHSTAPGSAVRGST